MFPIKYIDNNLVWNKDNEVFAYYELIPYNYSFLSPEQKYLVHDSFRQLIAQSREGKIHALQIATESSIRSIQEQSKKLVTWKATVRSPIQKDRRPDRSPCIHDRRQSSGLPFLSGIQAHGHRGRSQSEEHQKIGISDIP